MTPLIANVFVVKIQFSSVVMMSSIMGGGKDKDDEHINKYIFEIIIHYTLQRQSSIEWLMRVVIGRQHCRNW